MNFDKSLKVACLGLGATFLLNACGDDGTTNAVTEQLSQGAIYTCADGSVTYDANQCEVAGGIVDVVQPILETSSSDVAIPVSSSEAIITCDALTPECGYSTEDLCLAGLSNYCVTGSSSSVFYSSSPMGLSSSSIGAWSSSNIVAWSSSSMGFVSSSSVTQIVTNPTDDTESDDAAVDGSYPTLTFSAAGLDVTNDTKNCVVQGQNTVTITCSGKYNLTGSNSNFQVIVNVSSASDADNVKLYFNGLTLKSASEAPIFVQKAEKVIIQVVKGTTNTIEDGSTRSGAISYTTYNGEKSDTTGAAIYAKDDLTIKGSGSLTVKGNFNNGIHTSNDLKIKNGNIVVNAKNNGLKGKGSVEISGGTLNITATNGDGIKSDADDVTDLANGKGSVTISGGSVTVTSGYDAISATNALTVTTGENGDPTIKVTAGGGQTCLSLSSSSSQSSMGGRGGMGGMGGMGSTVSCSDTTTSKKGFKADSSITISAGTVEIDASDDGLHSNGNIEISGGNTTIKSDDDGIHSDKALYIKNQAVVAVNMAYEGMEAYEMHFDGGITSVITTDDGWNAAGGSATSSTGGNTGFGGWGGGFSGSSSIGYIYVTGGYHYIYVGSGDTDGVDSNKDISATGGVIIIECLMNGGMGGMMDSDGTTTVSGTSILGFGSSRSEEGTAYSVSFNSSNYYGNTSIAFKPSFSGSYMISSVGTPAVVNSVSGMTKTCFGNSTTNCVYTK